MATKTAAKKVATKKVATKKAATTAKKAPEKKVATLVEPAEPAKKAPAKKMAGTNLAAYAAGTGTKKDPAIMLVPLDQIHVKAGHNPRTDAKRVDDLVASIKGDGFTSAICVQPRKAGGYEIIAGERRFNAATQANMKVIPCIVREDIAGEVDGLCTALAENMARNDLDPLEIGAAIKKLEKAGLKQAAICKSTGIPAHTYRRVMAIMDAPKAVQNMVADGSLGQQAAVELAKADPSVQKEIMAQITPGASVTEIARLKKEVASTIAASATTKTDPKKRNQDKKGVDKDANKVIWRGHREIQNSLTAICNSLVVGAKDEQFFESAQWYEFRGSAATMFWARGDLAAPTLPFTEGNTPAEAKELKKFEVLVAAEAEKYVAPVDSE